ncbi:hypothetical protein [Microbacterium dauci]|uniref:DeoR-like transcriptional repressor C-terminal sensor domain-containing protein n=1 Tax=Microbacterium dauci TaxID=3048008 RepID=A0ABT6ZEP1_9MICO|nr:hypothetical protein [Microbacterium sp. LX3-4]MDJ1114180.1 hypothetical protein [Microbacterium sp. LX3-4]
MTVATNVASDFAFRGIPRLSGGSADVGRAGRSQFRLHGSEASDSARNRTFCLSSALDLAFISSSSWNLGHGVTTPVEAKIEAKRAAVESAERSVLMADSSKYGRFAKYRALRLDEVGTVITDAGLAE